MPNSNANKIVASIAFVAIAGSIASYSLMNQQVSTPTQTAQPTVVGMTATPTVMPSPTQAAGSYKNGVYVNTGNYGSPAGEESMDISITLDHDIITAASVTAKASNPVSKNFQEMFANNFKQYVIGKNINEVHLTKVSGASLTPQGFNDAVAKIKTQAKA